MAQILSDRAALATKNTVNRIRGQAYDRTRKTQASKKTIATDAFEYTGFFKVIDTSDDTNPRRISVVNGSDEDNAVCGFMFVGTVTVNFSRTNITVNANSTIIVYRHIYWDDGPQQYVSVINTSPNQPVIGKQTYTDFIYQVTADNDSITTISQQNFINVVAGRLV